MVYTPDVVCYQRYYTQTQTRDDDDQPWGATTTTVSTTLVEGSKRINSGYYGSFKIMNQNTQERHRTEYRLRVNMSNLTTITDRKSYLRIYFSDTTSTNLVVSFKVGVATDTSGATYNDTATVLGTTAVKDGLYYADISLDALSTVFDATASDRQDFIIFATEAVTSTYSSSSLVDNQSAGTSISSVLMTGLSPTAVSATYTLSTFSSSDVLMFYLYKKSEGYSVANYLGEATPSGTTGTFSASGEYSSDAYKIGIAVGTATPSVFSQVKIISASGLTLSNSVSFNYSGYSNSASRVFDIGGISLTDGTASGSSGYTYKAILLFNNSSLRSDFGEKSITPGSSAISASKVLVSGGTSGSAYEVLLVVRKVSDTDSTDLSYSNTVSYNFTWPTGVLNPALSGSVPAYYSNDSFTISLDSTGSADSGVYLYWASVSLNFRKSSGGAALLFKNAKIDTIVNGFAASDSYSNIGASSGELPILIEGWATDASGETSGVVNLWWPAGGVPFFASYGVLTSSSYCLSISDSYSSFSTVSSQYVFNPFAASENFTVSLSISNSSEIFDKIYAHSNNDVCADLYLSYPLLSGGRTKIKVKRSDLGISANGGTASWIFSGHEFLSEILKSASDNLFTLSDKEFYFLPQVVRVVNGVDKETSVDDTTQPSLVDGAALLSSLVKIPSVLLSDPSNAALSKVGSLNIGEGCHCANPGESITVSGDFPEYSTINGTEIADITNILTVAITHYIRVYYSTAGNLTDTGSTYVDYALAAGGNGLYFNSPTDLSLPMFCRFDVYSQVKYFKLTDEVSTECASQASSLSSVIVQPWTESSTTQNFILSSKFSVTSDNPIASFTTSSDGDGKYVTVSTRSVTPYSYGGNAGAKFTPASGYQNLARKGDSTQLLVSLVNENKQSVSSDVYSYDYSSLLSYLSDLTFTLNSGEPLPTNLTKWYLKYAYGTNICYSPIYTYYTLAPTLSLGVNGVGINTNAPLSTGGEVLLISNTEGKTDISMHFDGVEVGKFTLSSGGLIIDGGTWGS